MLVFTHGISLGAKRALAATFLLAFTAILISPQALACHRDDRPHGKEASCGDPNPAPGGEPTVINTMIDFEGTEIYAVDNAEPWTCTPELLEAPFTYASGTYNCNGSGGSIVFHADGGASTLEFSKKEAAICKTLNGLPNDEGVVLQPDIGGFSYGWTERCDLAPCAVAIHVVFSDGVSELTAGGADVLDVVMHGMVDNQSGDLNPFYGAADVLITRTEFAFWQTGARRATANCTLNTPAYREPYPAVMLSEPVTE